MSTETTHLIHFWNANSLLSKRHMVKTVLDQSPTASILAISETHLGPLDTHSLKVPGYTYLNRPYAKDSSGILIYIHRLYDRPIERALRHLASVTDACKRARQAYDRLANELAEQDWLAICRAVEGKPPHKAFKAWKRTVPSTNMPLNSITLF